MNGFHLEEWTVRDQWFIVALVLVVILSVYAPKFAGLLVVLTGVYIASVPLSQKGLFNGV